jgi:acetyl esterase
LTRDGLADEGLAEYVAAVRADPGPSARQLGAPALRAASARRAADRPRGPALASVVDHAAGPDGSVRARLYRPVDDARPLLVYLHGGGWTLGDLESHDRTCRRLAKAADVAVLAVDYRRAPESTWPAALDDAVEAYRWSVLQGPDLVGTSVVGLGGDSAGGNLATLVCLRLRDAGEPQPRAQLLVYPNTDLTFSSPSVVTEGTGWGLDADDAIWFAEQWVPDRDRRSHPRVSPLLEPDLSGVAPAVVVTAEHDPLRDEGDAYADRLMAAGVPTTHRCEVGMVHGFLGLDLFSPAAAAASGRYFDDVSNALS